MALVNLLRFLLRAESAYALSCRKQLVWLLRAVCGLSFCALFLMNRLFDDENGASLADLSKKFAHDDDDAPALAHQLS